MTTTYSTSELANGAYNRNEHYPANQLFPLALLRVGDVITEGHGALWIVYELYAVLTPFDHVQVVLVDMAERRHLRHITLQEFRAKTWYTIPNKEDENGRASDPSV